MIFYTGLLILLLSGLYIAYLITALLFFDITMDGWTSLITSLWFLGGLTIFFLGETSMSGWCHGGMPASRGRACYSTRPWSSSMAPASAQASRRR